MNIERTKRSLPTYYLVGTPPWSVLVINAHSLVPFQDYLRKIPVLPCRLVCRPNNGTRNVAPLPWMCQMHHAWPLIRSFHLCALSDVPPLVRRSSRTCNMTRLHRLSPANPDKVEQDVGQQVDWEQRGPPPGSRSHPACATCMTYGRWYEPTHRYLNIPFTCTWVLYDYFS